MKNQKIRVRLTKEEFDAEIEERTHEIVFYFLL